VNVTLEPFVAGFGEALAVTTGLGAGVTVNVAVETPVRLAESVTVHAACTLMFDAPLFTALNVKDGALLKGEPPEFVHW
jgi:hypothetical protein